MDAVNDSDSPPPAKKLVANPGGGGGDWGPVLSLLFV